MPKDSSRQLIPIDGYRCSYGSYRSLAAAGLHTHNAYEIHVHMRGEGHFRIGQDSVLLQPLDTYVIAPGQVHGLENTEPTRDFEFLELSLPKEMLSELSFRDCRLSDGLEEIIAHPHQRLTLTQELWRNIHPLISGVKPDGPSLHPVERQISLGCLSVILGMLCLISRRTNVPYITSANTASIIRRVELHISQHFTDDCSLHRLSEMFGISPYHLSRQFTLTCGMTLHQYLLMNRVAYARRLLQQGEAPSSVAQSCGFGDYSSFLRAFTRLTGQSPSQWKRTHPAVPLHTE